MKRRKATSKQERFKLVAKFLKSGQSQGVWCNTEGIAPSTFSKWIHEYKRESVQTKFIELAPETVSAKSTQKSIYTDKEVVIEIGPCKFHVTEQIALSFMLKAMEVNSHDI